MLSSNWNVLERSWYLSYLIDIMMTLHLVSTWSLKQKILFWHFDSPSYAVGAVGEQECNSGFEKINNVCHQQVPVESNFSIILFYFFLFKDCPVHPVHNNNRAMWRVAIAYGCVFTWKNYHPEIRITKTRCNCPLTISIDPLNSTNSQTEVCAVWQ